MDVRIDRVSVLNFPQTVQHLVIMAREQPPPALYMSPRLQKLASTSSRVPSTYPSALDTAAPLMHPVCALQAREIINSPLHSSEVVKGMVFYCPSILRTVCNDSALDTAAPLMHPVGALQALD